MSLGFCFKKLQVFHRRALWRLEAVRANLEQFTHPRPWVGGGWINFLLISRMDQHVLVCISLAWLLFHMFINCLHFLCVGEFSKWAASYFCLCVCSLWPPGVWFAVSLPCTMSRFFWVHGRIRKRLTWTFSKWYYAFPSLITQKVLIIPSAPFRVEKADIFPNPSYKPLFKTLESALVCIFRIHKIEHIFMFVHSHFCWFHSHFCWFCARLQKWDYTTCVFCSLFL